MPQAIAVQIVFIGHSTRVCGGQMSPEECPAIPIRVGSTQLGGNARRDTGTSAG